MMIECYLNWLICPLLLMLTLSPGAVQLSRAAIARMTDDSWKEYHYKIYETDVFNGNIMTPEQTRDMLRKLAKIYEPYSDEQTNGRKSRIQALEQASHIGLELCNRHRFVSYERLVHYHTSYKINLLPYLDYYYHEFYHLCIDNHYEILHGRVGLIEQELRDDMHLFAKYVAETPVSRSEPALGWQDLARKAPLGNLNVGVIEFLKHKLGFLDVKLYKDSTLGKARYFQDLDDNVFKLCRTWSQAVDFTMALTQMGVPIVFTDEEDTWIMFGFLCGKVFLRADEIYRDTYKVVKKMREVDTHGNEISKFAAIWHNVADSNVVIKLKKIVGHGNNRNNRGSSHGCFRSRMRKRNQEY